MFKLFRESVYLTLLVGVPMMLTNNLLSYLQKIEFDKEWLILIVVMVGLMLIGYPVAVKPIIDEFRQADRSRTHK